MKESSTQDSIFDRLRFWTHSKAHGDDDDLRGSSGVDDGTLDAQQQQQQQQQLQEKSAIFLKSSSGDGGNLLAVSNPRTNSSSLQSQVSESAITAGASHDGQLPRPPKDGERGGRGSGKRSRVRKYASSSKPGPSHSNAQMGINSNTPANTTGATSTQTPIQGQKLEPDANYSATNTTTTNNNNITSTTTTNNDSENNDNESKKNVFTRFYLTARQILLSSWINVLLIFVPIGIAVQCVPGMSPTVVFAMNAIAIIPLAALLSYATETVAHRFGDAIGALLNITFGNAVELIIFIVALVKNEIRIVQASLLGSILANLLLILGMAFFLGGLRFQEQIYNSTVTQMSACLLSLSVISLVLPTAFHASFSDTDKADLQTLKISRGTSVILLLVYVIYLLFQLKSHAYMYKSTPQDVIDAESTPGPAVAWFDSSSSDDSSSSSSDSDDSGRSRETVSKRVKRAIRGGRRRKSSLASVDTAATDFRAASVTTPMQDDSNYTPEGGSHMAAYLRHSLIDADEEAIEDEGSSRQRKKRKHSRRFRKHRKFHSDTHETNSPAGETIDEVPENADKLPANSNEPRRVDFAMQQTTSHQEGSTELLAPKRPLHAFRNISLRPVARGLTPAVFTGQPVPSQAVPNTTVGPVPRVRYGIRRTNSLPDRLNMQIRPPGAMLPPRVPLSALVATDPDVTAETAADSDISNTSAVLLLLISTGLVAVCAEFMVSSINGLVATSNISEAFVGLIILPIVGNAAEHVTAVSVGLRNKMDLAIGVAVGSSIQIALFITPIIVILGWILNKDMSLYFTLFETVCLFVSAFIVNFLVLDGRSNYLEGALLCATYVIISVVAFYYPSPEDASAWGA